MKKFIKKLTPSFLLDLITAYLFQRNSNYTRLKELDIKRSGTSADGYPFVELSNGRIFYGYFPSPAQKLYYRYWLNRVVKRNLQEDSLNVAVDIILRYLGPASPERYIENGKYYDFAPGDLVVEVGAFMGYYAMRAAELVGTAGKVIAIEAVEENVQLIRKNIEANSIKNITLIPLAAWKAKEELKFYRTTRQQASAVANVVASLEEFKVPSDTIDNILSDLGSLVPSFIRIQVNGAEQEVLLGMQNTLKQGPKLLIAAIYQRSNQASWIHVQKFLQDNHYSSVVKDGNVFAVPSAPA
ncbi:MAG: FkbM family methyltransferase [Anaerolineales bacterium]|nr:FkbM family methyltransferase [Anaerolineales bacterium]